MREEEKQKQKEYLEKKFNDSFKYQNTIKEMNSNEKYKNYTNDGDIIQNNQIKNKNTDNVFSDKTGEKARKFIQNIEGFRSDAYQDTGGVWTIGYGHTKDVKPGDKVTKDEAGKFFIEDFEHHSAPLKYVKVELSDNEKIALISFIYNVGVGAFKNSTLLKKLNQGDKKGAAEEFDKWIYDNGKINQGLINRRAKEKEKFLSPDE